ncbi:protein YABBY 3-like [Cornus florida]|uniref:protein YABBY 3-like n=1 Tax=Cornus florida TaxID=4283 RepID=UPI002899CE05|nr:protein YABBY 3-like [Cornus florida]
MEMYNNLKVIISELRAELAEVKEKNKLLANSSVSGQPPPPPPPPPKEGAGLILNSNSTSILKPIPLVNSSLQATVASSAQPSQIGIAVECFPTSTNADDPVLPILCFQPNSPQTALAPPPPLSDHVQQLQDNTTVKPTPLHNNPTITQQTKP